MFLQTNLSFFSLIVQIRNKNNVVVNFSFFSSSFQSLEMMLMKKKNNQKKVNGMNL